MSVPHRQDKKLLRAFLRFRAAMAEAEAVWPLSVEDTDDQTIDASDAAFREADAHIRRIAEMPAHGPLGALVKLRLAFEFGDRATEYERNPADSTAKCIHDCIAYLEQAAGVSLGTGWAP